MAIAVGWRRFPAAAAAGRLRRRRLRFSSRLRDLREPRARLRERVTAPGGNETNAWPR